MVIVGNIISVARVKDRYRSGRIKLRIRGQIVGGAHADLMASADVARVPAFAVRKLSELSAQAGTANAKRWRITLDKDRFVTDAEAA